MRHLLYAKDFLLYLCFQQIARSSLDRKDTEGIIHPPYRYSEMSTISNADNGHNICKKGGGTHHHIEEQSDDKCGKMEKLHPSQKKSSPHTTVMPKNTYNSTRCSYQTNPDKKSSGNDVIAQKTSPLVTSNSNVPQLPWNLPMKNSFTTYSKPLPAVPKLPDS
uniref:Uncharacterized protein n=1 Tax=Octopus bimaculoides TaxID=37653 RepID=A0A0L8H751_OCTBM